MVSGSSASSTSRQLGELMATMEKSDKYQRVRKKARGVAERLSKCNDGSERQDMAFVLANLVT